MDNIKKVVQAIHIGIVVAQFLLNTSRVLKAIKLCKECLFLINDIAPYMTRTFVRLACSVAYFQMFNGYALINDYTSAIQWGRKSLVLLRESGKKDMEGKVTIHLAELYAQQCKYTEAEELYKKALSIMITTGERKLERVCYAKLGFLFCSIGEYVKAKEFHQKALDISTEIGDKQGKASSYGNLGAVFQSLSDFIEAKKFYEKALDISTEIGDKQCKASSCGNLGTLFQSQGDYIKAKEFHQKALDITTEIGDKQGKASSYGNLGTLFQSQGDYIKAKEFHQKALDITTEIGDKQGKAYSYGNLGTVFHSLSECIKAKEYVQKALAIHKEIGDKKGEASSYENLGALSQYFGEYNKAEKYFQKALRIRDAIGDNEGEASSYGSLGNVSQLKGEFIKAEEYLLKGLQITKEIGNKKQEALHYGNLATVFQAVGKYAKAEEYLEKALAITKEIGDRNGQAATYENLGVVFHFVGEYVKSKEYLQKALQIRVEIGDKKGEASCYGNLGTAFLAPGESVDKAKSFIQKELQISIEIGDQHGIARGYQNQGRLFRALGEYDKAEENLLKSLQISEKIGHQKGKASCYAQLGTMFRYVGEYSKAEKLHEKALELSCKIGDIELQFISHLNLTLNTIHLKGNIHEVVSNLVESIRKSEEIRGFLRDKDQFNISFLDKHLSSYQLLSLLFCVTGKHSEALYVVELGRARALADLMSVRYRVEIQISVDQESWVGIDKILEESGRICLYISYYNRHLFLWIIKRNKVILFRQMDINDSFGNKEGKRNVEDVFGNVTFRKFPHLSQGQYEDRSLSPSNISHLTCESSHECSQEVSRPFVTEEDDEVHEPPTLSECYKMIIAPVADLLDEPEIIIVPDRILYKVPFAAFKDESAKYLSDSFRLRIVPSLMTLKLIQDSPADYHSQIGALIVGDPQVGHVTYKGHLEWISPLSCARKEAEMIGRLLGAQPLLGEHATKQAVLQSIHSVSLIHFAAHGDAQRGEIALAPPTSCNGIPEEEDYLLTMAEISQVRLTAKLVVLSCCHSARGQIRSEGVVGIARAFLGSGARSVLVALWAIQDEATEQFMSRFYEHLVRGESASESLHQAMKWMRANGFSDVEQWAPFMLIGDDVTFEFGK